MPSITVPPGVEGIVGLTQLPDPAFVERWERIILPTEQKEHLLNHLIFSLGHRGSISSVGLPVHGLVVLLDEVEALAVTRQGASLETNPVDVHRATDAVLAGVDHVSAVAPNVTFVATTNFLSGVDVAFLSRADVVEVLGSPNAAAMALILADTLAEVAPGAAAEAGSIEGLCDRMAEIRMDARQVRKLVLRAVCSRRDLALDPASLTMADVVSTFEATEQVRSPGPDG